MGEKLKITDMKLYFVPFRFLYLKVETDEGLCGWGEPIVEGRAATMAGAVNEWRDYFIGKDPLLIEDHWQTMYRGAFYRGGPVLMSTIAGIDQALWDIKGKFYNMPVYEMIGGAVKDSVKVYRNLRGDTAAKYAADAKKALAEGYSLLKFSPNPSTHYIDSYDKVDDVVEKISAVQEAVGKNIDLAVDFHGRIHKPMAKVLVNCLNQFRLAFIEEPVLPTNKEALRELANHTGTPIAMGERMYSRWDFKDMLIDGYIDIVQPDLSHAGGISECRRIGAMAEAFDVAFAPHCPLSVIAFAACIQTDIATPNAVFQEQSIDIYDGSAGNNSLRWLRNPNVFECRDGFVPLPKGPGLGIEINEELVVEAGKDKHNWKNPLWRTYDGTPIEW
jgi:galactonate dehydratase